MQGANYRHILAAPPACLAAEISMSDRHTSDVLVIGSGIAGLSLALRLADDMDVTVINKSRFPESNTYYAQGGIAAVLSEQDSLESHVRDTVDAGAGLCHPATVLYVAERGPACADWLWWAV